MVDRIEGGNTTNEKQDGSFFVHSCLTALVTYNSAVSVERFFPKRRLKALNHLLIIDMRHCLKRDHLLNYLG